MSDIDRLCTNHPAQADLIRMLAAWIIEQLAENPDQKGETRVFPGESKTYRRWAAGPIVVVFSMLPQEDQTVIIEGFLPAR